MRATRVSEVSTSSRSMTSIRNVSVNSRSDSRKFLYDKIASISPVHHAFFQDSALSLSPGWVTGHSDLFQSPTPKSLSPKVSRKTRRSIVNYNNSSNVSEKSSVFKKPGEVFISPTGVKTRARRSSIYQKSGKNLLSGISTTSKRESLAAIRSKKYAAEAKADVTLPNPTILNRKKLVSSKNTQSKKSPSKRKSLQKSEKTTSSKVSHVEKSVKKLDTEKEDYDEDAKFSPRRTRQTPSKAKVRSLSAVRKSDTKRKRSPSTSPSSSQRKTSSVKDSAQTPTTTKGKRRSVRTITPSLRRRSLDEDDDSSSDVTNSSVQTPTKESPSNESTSESFTKITSPSLRTVSSATKKSSPKQSKKTSPKPLTKKTPSKSTTKKTPSKSTPKKTPSKSTTKKTPLKGSANYSDSFTAIETSSSNKDTLKLSKKSSPKLSVKKSPPKISLAKSHSFTSELSFTSQETDAILNSSEESINNTVPKTSPKSRTPLSSLKMKSILDSVTTEKHSSESSNKKRKNTDSTEIESASKRRKFDLEKFEKIIASTPRDMRLDILSGRRPELSPISGHVNKNLNNSLPSTKQVTIFSDKTTFSTTGPSNLSPIVAGSPLSTRKETHEQMDDDEEDDFDYVDNAFSTISMPPKEQPYLFDYDTDQDTSHSNIRSGCTIL